MIIEQQVKRLIRQLGQSEYACIDVGGSTITIKTMEQGKKLFLSTPVYFGGNYIPHSVRDCVNSQSPFLSHGLKTSLNLNEKEFKIYLVYKDDTANINNIHFVQVLEDFSDLAGKWREYLDEHDRNDLVPVHVR